jgi:hypothetical protein
VSSWPVGRLLCASVAMWCPHGMSQTTGCCVHLSQKRFCVNTVFLAWVTCQVLVTLWAQPARHVHAVHYAYHLFNKLRFSELHGKLHSLQCSVSPRT